MGSHPAIIDPTPYLSIPYKWFGRGFDGCDCWGLAWLIQRNEFGREIPMQAPPVFMALMNPSWNMLLMAGFMGVQGLQGDGHTWREVRMCELQPGDIMLSPPIHVLTWLGDGRAIHQVNPERGVLVEDWKLSTFAKVITTAYRFVPRPKRAQLLHMTTTSVSRFCRALGIPLEPCDTPTGRGANAEVLHRVLELPEARDEWIAELVNGGTEGQDFAYDNFGRPRLAEALVRRIVCERDSVRGRALAEFLQQCERVHQALESCADHA